MSTTDQTIVTILVGCVFVLGIFLGKTLGIKEGIKAGAEMHYKGELVCETLLDKTVRCIPASSVKEK